MRDRGALAGVRPGGGALLMWGTYDSASAALIAVDGLSVGPPVSLLDARRDVLNGFPPTGAWIDLQDVLRLQRVSPDGTLALVAEILKNEWAFAPAFAIGAADLRLVYSGVPPGGQPGDPTVLWRRLGPAGELLGQPVALAADRQYVGAARAAAVSDDTVVLLNTLIQGDLFLVRVDIDGKIVKPAYGIAKAPTYSINDFAIVRRGPELVVGWTANNRLTLARVAP